MICCSLFVRFFKALDSFKFQSSVATYLTRIAINLTKNEIKRKQRFRHRFVPLDESSVSQDVEDDTQVPKKYLRKMANIFHKQNLNEVKTENDDVETLYETVV